MSISCFNATGVAVTKYASAPQRSTVDTCRTLLIWVISLWPLKSEPLVPLSAVEALAFVLLIFGTLVYNEILILPCEFMNKNTKAKLEGSDDEALQSIRDMNYMATSPTAKYDNNRNMRNIEKGQRNK